MLPKGTAVVSSDARTIGTVVHVLAAEDKDVFDGIVIDEQFGPGGHRFVDADEIAEIHQDGVLLKLTREQSEHLPTPSANPAVMRDDPTGGASSQLADKLRRAWHYISGNY